MKRAKEIIFDSSCRNKKKAYWHIMIITIHQPDFIPWLGFFHRWAVSDLYIVLDDVQFLRRGWHHRDRIKTASGECWLTIPVRKKGRYLQQIRQVELDNDQIWRQKHLRTIEVAYKKAPNFDHCYVALKEIYLNSSSTNLRYGF